MQKPAKYTVVCWTGFWVSFESMEKKRRKKELYFLLWCDRFFWSLFVFMPASLATVSSRL